MRKPLLSLGLALVALLWSLWSGAARAASDPLPSWNEGPAKQAILEFVKATTTRGAPGFVPEAERIATSPYTDLTYLPMQDLMRYLRASGFKTYMVTGGGQDFVRVYSEATYGIQPEQIVGSAGGTSYGYDANGRPFLTKEPKLLLNDDKAGKPEGIHLVIGRRPIAAFGNSDGDKQMLEYTKAGSSVRLAMILLHDDAKREYAYGPANGLPATHVGAFTPALYDQAQKDGWVVIRMKDDWKRVFSFEP